MKSLSLDILKSALWHLPVPSDPITSEVYQELFDQTVHLLVYDITEQCHMDESLRERWAANYAKQISLFAKYLMEQQELVKLLKDKDVVPVILKGLSAAMYYPEPLYRVIGDIDFMLCPGGEERFAEITALLKEHGFIVSEKKNPRHLCFSKNGFSYEMHRHFSEKASKGEEELDRIINKSTPVEKSANDWPEFHFYSFPDEINGLILIQHINQHLISGLGLRQIIDWMFFVEAVVTDEFWEHTFKPLADRTGLTTLAVTVTKLCEMYLGAPKHSWAAEADVSACKELFALIEESGNFGRKRNVKDNRVTTMLNQKGLSFKGLQQRGLYHWKAAQKHKILRPFAWIYQICRYIKEGLIKRDPNYEGFFTSFKRHRQQKKLFKKLKIWQYRE